MSRQFSPKTLQRQTPNHEPQQCFETNGVALEVDWGFLRARRDAPHYEVILVLPNAQRDSADQDFPLVLQMDASVCATSCARFGISASVD